MCRGFNIHFRCEIDVLVGCKKELMGTEKLKKETSK
jgi:hypothetical protein